MKIRFIITLAIICAQQIVYGQSFDCETTHYNISYSIQGNSLIKEVDVLIQINNRNCSFDKIFIPFSKGDGLTIIDAGIRDANGNLVRKLKNNEIKTKSAVSTASLYEDDFVKWFELAHNSYPYSVYYKYKLNYNKFATIDQWQPYYASEMPCKSAKLQLTVPKNYPIQFYQREIEGKIDTLEKSIVYSWTGSFPGLRKKEIYAPPIDEIFPHVILQPLNFNYGVKGSFASWTDFGNFIFNLNQGLNNLPVSEKAQIDKMTKGVEDPKEISKILYRYLQERTRYINVKLGIGGLKPYPAEYVAINKYGDCKALTNYMKSMLEYAGVPSYYSLIYAGANPVRPIRDFPGDYFNHVMLMVPYQEDTVWLECTDNSSPFGHLGTFTQGREAFVIDKDNSRFFKTPALSIEENVHSTKSSIQLDESSGSSAEFTFSLRGGYFNYYNQILTILNDKEKEKYVRELIPFASYELKDWKIKKADREMDEINIFIKAVPVNYPKKYGNDMVVSGFHVIIPPFEPPGTRKMPVRLNYPLHRSDTAVYSIPASYRLTHSLTNLHIESEFGSYSFQFDQKEGEITFIKNLILYKNEIPINEYKKFFDFLTLIKTQEGKNAIVLNKK